MAAPTLFIEALGGDVGGHRPRRAHRSDEPQAPYRQPFRDSLSNFAKAYQANCLSHEHARTDLRGTRQVFAKVALRAMKVIERSQGEENRGLGHADGVFRNLAIRHEDAVFRRGRNIEPFDPCERRNQCAQTRHPGKQLPVGCKA